MKEKIAIIGMGCVFPDALDFTQYWQNIVEGKNSIREVEPEFWSAEEFYDPDPNVPRIHITTLTLKPRSHRK